MSHLYIVAYRAKDGRLIRAWDPDNEGALFAPGDWDRAATYAAQANAMPGQQCPHFVCEVLLYDAGTDSVHEMIPRRMPGEAPNAALYHDPSAAYLRSLIERTGLSQNAAARQLGISDRSMRYYLSETDRSNPAPYIVQVALEELAGSA
jgi:predicted DNA-binding protein (UPF0251 family)